MTVKSTKFVRQYKESNDRSENSDFLLLHQKDPFGELFSEINIL